MCQDTFVSGEERPINTLGRTAATMLTVRCSPGVWHSGECRLRSRWEYTEPSRLLKTVLSVIRYSVDYGAQAQHSNRRAGSGGASHAAIDYDIELGEKSRLGSKGSRRLYIIL